MRYRSVWKPSYHESFRKNCPSRSGSDLIRDLSDRFPTAPGAEGAGRDRGVFLPTESEGVTIEGVDRAVPKEGTVSRNRRLVVLAGLVLAIVGGVPAARTQTEDPAQGSVSNPAADSSAPPSLMGNTPPADAALPALDVPPAPAPAQPKAQPAPRPTVPAAAKPVIPPPNPEPRRDENVIPAQQPPAASAPPPAAGAPATPFSMDPSTLPLGPQAVGLSVQVVAPPAMTLHKPATVTILVKNTSPADVYGVVVRDELPPGAKYLKSLPEASNPPPPENPGGLVVWNLGTLSAGVEKQLKVTVEPVQKGPMDHAATVTLASGSRAKTVVLQPVLRVEQTVSKTNVLKGQQVLFDITITNDGDGPAPRCSSGPTSARD